jgi:hypothetical protein
MQYDTEKTQGAEMPIERDRRHARETFADQCEIGRLKTSAEILHEVFSYHPPTEVTLPKFAAINQAAKNFAEVVLQNCPSSADRSAAIRLIRDARMTANASVALNGLSL